MISTSHVDVQSLGGRHPHPPALFLLLRLGFRILFVENLHQGFGHVVWLLQGAIIPLQVFH